MAWYYGTYSCGHEGRTQVYGPVKNRQWIADRRFEGLCPECYQKHLEEEMERKNKEAAEKAKEMELPELQGTEKQVVWANTIRQQLIEKFNNEIDGLDDKSLKMELFKILDYMLQNKTNASWYINNRYTLFTFLLEDLEKEIPTEEEIKEKDLETQIKIESTVYPENKVTNAVVEIKVLDDTIKVYFEKNNDFIKIVKDLGYKWNGVWKREINYTNGTVEDRAAELGNKLLNEGFPICILDEEIRRKAIEGDYEEECTRWIYIRKEGKYKGWLVIKWQGYNNRLYNVARKLPGSKWDSGVVVRIEHIDEVQEFAELYGFRFSKGAIKAIERYKESLKLAEVVTPVEVKENEKKDGLKEILSSDTCILPDLFDEGE